MKPLTQFEKMRRNRNRMENMAYRQRAVEKSAKSFNDWLDSDVVRVLASPAYWPIQMDRYQ